MKGTAKQNGAKLELVCCLYVFVCENRHPFSWHARLIPLRQDAWPGPFGYLLSLLLLQVGSELGSERKREHLRTVWRALELIEGDEEEEDERSICSAGLCLWPAKGKRVSLIHN